MYQIEYTEKAKQDFASLRKYDPEAFKKATKLTIELMEHPQTGTGHPEPLRGDRTGQWSRRISKKHRLIYEIHEQQVVVLVLTAYGHYEDK